MLSALISVFIITYLAIAFEHPLKLNKSASALLGAGVLWTLLALGSDDAHLVGKQLDNTLVSTAQIVFFLIGAMTIVEVVDAHQGFEVVTSRIRTSSLTTLIWLISWVTFFLSAILDNLTTTIVMVSLLPKLLAQREDRLYVAGMIIIAANAGGAWSPIGDVTTTMLWIGGHITPAVIVRSLLLPSVVNLLVPLLVITWLFKGQRVQAPHLAHSKAPHTSKFERNLMFFLGLGLLVAVPAFKTFTHLPPFMGALLGLGLLWVVGDRLHQHKSPEERNHLDLSTALSRIDLASIAFFIGILLAVATLEHTHILVTLAIWLDHAIGRQDLIIMLIGILSAVVDNVPLVAASIGMYNLNQYPTDSFLWEFLAYCAGTGGSILIIGSAAGVAAMGIEKINFMWYLRRISWLAGLGYVAGALVYVTERSPVL